jgi:ubiquinone/menaquinone biosynthesis C-methylase UbiE
MSLDKTKNQVRQFYDEVGWKRLAKDQFQNAQFEDLRPVSSEYIHRCHMRVKRSLKADGKFLLDAGSGPVQYPEYLAYSSGYHFRVCLDISLTALVEAREKLKEHGLVVLADVTNLPFQRDTFDGIVSLHTFHHLAVDDQLKAYHEVQRTLVPGTKGVVVNGWKTSPIMNRFNRLMALVERFTDERKNIPIDWESEGQRVGANKKPNHTFVDEYNAPFLKTRLAGQVPLEIRVWRSVNVRFLRTMIHPWLGGRIWLKIIYWLEERFPNYLGENGAYPLVVISK